MALDLPLIWGLIIAFAVLMYVVMDGFDLGVGILFAIVKGDDDRDLMVNSVAPVWDGNATWLVLGGGGLFAVFPLAYSILLTAFYAPIIVMLLALIFRGVAFEFRFKDPAHRPFWDWAFMGGSMVATFAQGVVLGAFIQGIATAGRAYAGGWFDWLTPFSVFTGLALIGGYALLGAAWLVRKTEHELQERFFAATRHLVVVVVGLIVIVSLWTPFLNPEIATRWFSWPNLLYVSPVPILVAVPAICLYRAIERRRDILPFFLALGLFMLSYAGLGISLFPHIVPPHITIWDAAAPPESLLFLLAGTAVLIPVILAYTGYAYWIFRGKVQRGKGYH